MKEIKLSQLKTVIDGTMNLLLTRREMHPSYGWLDLKIDAITAQDHFNDNTLRGSKKVYSWIQGRGLEAVTVHANWYKQFSGYSVPDIDALVSMAKEVSQKLQASVDAGHGHVYFTLDSPSGSCGKYTMSDLFCSRGLFAYESSFGTEEGKARTKKYLVDTLEAIISGNFYNDQESLSPHFQVFIDGRTSFAGQMLALGAVVLLMKMGKDEKAPQLGMKLIDYVLTKHCNTKKRWKNLTKDTIVEWLGQDGLPARNEEGRICLDPGHALEFVGLASQMIQAWLDLYSLSNEEKEWVNNTLLLLPSVLKANYKHGVRENGSIAKGVDGETDEAIFANMPWWSLPETMRALVLVKSLCHITSSWFEKTTVRCFSTFMKYFYHQSLIGVAVQTIDSSGKAVPVIPATPDLDPGYHTGLSFITCYNELAKKEDLVLQKAEEVITPKRKMMLCGHVARDKKFESVLDDIKARLLILRAPFSQTAIVSIDVLELDCAWCKKVAQSLEEKIGVQSSSIIICSTHTHTATATITLGTLDADKAYCSHLEKVLAKMASCKKTFLVKPYIAMAQSDFGINRRYRDPITGKVSMKPNAEGCYDKSLPVVAFKSSDDGSVQAILFNTAVHPTTLGVEVYKVSADYPGRVISCLKREYGANALVIPITGACGDVRPALLNAEKNGFRDGDEKDIEEIGRKVASSIVKALENAVEVQSTVVSAVVLSKEVDFEMMNVPTKEELKQVLKNEKKLIAQAREQEKDLDDFSKKHDNPLWSLMAEKRWAERLIAQEEIAQVISEKVSLICICGKIYIYCVPGELFTEVGLKIKDLTKEGHSLLCGYANGSLGYLPSKTAIMEGGYEVSDAFKYYGLPGGFTPSLETSLIEAMLTLVQ